MSNSSHTFIETTLSFLRSSQLEDGSFPSFISSDPHTFRHPLFRHTTFITSCIVNSLISTGLPEAKDIIEKGVEFLVKERSASWTWNYRANDARKTVKRGYPDDLDDTMCALAALKQSGLVTLSGDTLAHIVRTLTTLEKAPGGPYNTWVLKTDHRGPWVDIDLAVNANVAYFLSLVDVSLPPLNKYIEQAIKNARYESRYYHTPYPIIYFITRSYNGHLKEELISFLLTRQNEEGYWNNPLDTAYVVSSLERLQYAGESLTKARTYLKDIADQGLFLSYPSYIDEIRSDMCWFSGSPSLTAAFCLEALMLRKNPKEPIEETINQEETEIVLNIKALVKERLKTLPSPLRAKAQEAYEAVLKRDTGGDIILLSHRFASLLKGKKVKNVELISKLGYANLVGWIAYRLYDDLLDRDSLPDTLPPANFWLRELTSVYESILGNDSTIFHKVMDDLENANLWEQLNARVLVKNRKITINQIPRYKRYNLLSDKSFGHALGPITLLLLSGYSLDSQEVKHTIGFFNSYLIARQLNDDAHDWEEDLRRGQLNPASAHVLELWTKKENLEFPLTLDLNEALTKMKKIFWEESMNVIARAINYHVTSARGHTKAIKTFNLLPLDTLLAPLERASKNALYTHKSVTSFIREYYQTYKR